MTDLTRCKEFLRSFNGFYGEWADTINVLEVRIGRMKKEIDKLERQIDSFAMLTLWGRIKFTITRKFP